jgi:hypothetical protein
VIVAVPEDIPIIVPTGIPIPATVGVPELHVPPGTELPRSVLSPTQKMNVPVMGPGDRLTVITFPEMQPANEVYEMVAVPGPFPSTIPEDVPTVDTGGVSLSQVPPVGIAVRVMDSPTQTVLLPEMMGVG